MKQLLKRLFSQEYLSKEEATQTLIRIAESAYNPAEVAAFMTVFQMRPIATQELQGFRTALLALAHKVDWERDEAIDLCGTGGDGKDTFNISTLSAVVVAGAGYPVTKHGNYGVSSVCGSSNVLEALGYQFTNNADKLQRQVDKHNLCFLHAPLFHPAMKAVAPIRKQLGVRTFFNLLGPLVNPLQPHRQLVGVSNLEILRLYQYLLQQTKREFAIVYALDGYDEVSLTGTFKLITNKEEQMLSPQQIGQKKHLPAALHGGKTIREAATVFTNILQGEGTAAQNEVVSTNAGLAIQRFKPKIPLEDCIAEAHETLISRKAYQNFQSLITNQEVV